MRKIIYSVNLTLDGFMEGPDHELDWTVVEEELHTFFNDQEQKVDTHLYGRRMYETMKYWETADANPSSSAVELEYARIWKNKSKIVFSKTLERVEGNARLVRDDIVNVIESLKAQPGKDMYVGGAEIASSLRRLGWIDEYWLFVHPVVLGRGKPAFPAMDGSINLRLAETRTFRSGVVFLRYQQADRGQ